SLFMVWLVFLWAPRSYLRQDAFEKQSIVSRVRHRRLGGRAHFAALDHDRPVEAGGFQRGEHRAEVDFAGAELDHHVGAWRRAVLRAKPGDVLRDRLQLFDRILAGVVDDVAGVVPDLEILMPD